MGTALVCEGSRSSFSKRDLAAHGCDSVFAETGPGGGASEYAVFDSSKIEIIEIRRR